MNKLPDRIYVCYGGGGQINDPGYWFKKKLDKDPFDVEYVKGSLTTELADALELALPCVKAMRIPAVETVVEAALKKIGR